MSKNRKTPKAIAFAFFQKTQNFKNACIWACWMRNSLVKRFIPISGTFSDILSNLSRKNAHVQKSKNTKGYSLCVFQKTQNFKNACILACWMRNSLVKRFIPISGTFIAILSNLSRKNAHLRKSKNTKGYSLCVFSKNRNF